MWPEKYQMVLIPQHFQLPKLQWPDQSTISPDRRPMIQPRTFHVRLFEGKSIVVQTQILAKHYTVLFSSTMFCFIRYRWWQSNGELEVSSIYIPGTKSPSSHFLLQLMLPNTEFANPFGRWKYHPWKPLVEEAESRIVKFSQNKFNNKSANENNQIKIMFL
jgi:hypothetical protein